MNQPEEEVGSAEEQPIRNKVDGYTVKVAYGHLFYWYPKMSKKTYSNLFRRCKYRLIKFFLFLYVRPRWILKLSFKCPKKDSNALVLFGISLSSRKWNISGNALISIRLTFRIAACLYQIFPVKGFILTSLMNFLLSTSQSYRDFIQYCLCSSESIL